MIGATGAPANCNNYQIGSKRSKILSAGALFGAFSQKLLAGTEPQPFKSLSYGDALDLYIKQHLNYTSRAHRIEAERLLRRHFPFKTLDEIDRKAVVPLLDDLTPSIRDHALRRLKAFLNWCVDRDYLPSNALIRLKSGGGTTKRDRVLSDDELRRIWHACPQALSAASFRRSY